MFWYLYRQILTLHKWLILNSEMTLSIDASIYCLTPNHWILGFSKVCEQATTKNPLNTIISWENKECIFYLRKRVKEDDFLLSENSKNQDWYTKVALWPQFRILGLMLFAK